MKKLPHVSQQEHNRLQGKLLEEVFERQAHSCGLLPISNGLSARWIGPGKVQAVKSQLDFKLIRRDDGRVGYYDCKCFSEAFFDYSRLSKNQVDQAILFNECHVPAGFIVWFQSINTVCFYSGRRIDSFGPRTRFTPEHGDTLGSIEYFDLKRVFEV